MVRVPIRGVVARVLRRASARRAALQVAAARGRGLVLVYHRLAPGGAAPHEVVPCVPCDLFQRHIELLGEMGDVVPLADLLEPPGSRRRVRFAISFDDDYASHHQYALPILRRVGAPATFFLSGRALHGLGPYWWEQLEQLIAERGVREAARLLGVDAATPARLAAACERPERSARLSVTPIARSAPALDGDAIRALADAGMTIGFHTLHHPVLTQLPDAALDAALRAGRAELAAAAGRSVELLAYPHGRADERVAERTRAAGYRAAFATGARPVGPRSDPFLLGRWEAGPLTDDEFLSHLALRLNYPLAVPPR
jgi:peptidoglycan/xylan/chitin deacetylase (PgdA/CDA1 family)